MSPSDTIETLTAVIPTKQPVYLWGAPGGGKSSVVRQAAAGAGRANTALNNRFLRLDLEVSVEDWQAWAVANGVAPEVRAFIRFRPAMLFQFDPTTNPRAFASPRSWEFAGKVFASAPPR